MNSVCFATQGQCLVAVKPGGGNPAGAIPVGRELSGDEASRKKPKAENTVDNTLAKVLCLYSGNALTKGTPANNITLEQLLKIWHLSIRCIPRKLQIYVFCKYIIDCVFSISLTKSVGRRM